MAFAFPTLRLYPIVALVVAMGIATLPLAAQFTPPRRITPEGKSTTSYHVGLDFFEHLVIAHEEGGELAVETLGAGLDDHSEIGLGQEPRLAFSLLETFVVYSAPGAIDPALERRILLRSRVGPTWGKPQAISSGPGDHRRPAIQTTPAGTCSVVWERRLQNTPTTIWFRRGSGIEVEIGPGEHPTLVLDSAGRAHLFFLRNQDIYYSKESALAPGTFAPSGNVTASPEAPESPPQVAIYNQRRIFLCYERTGTVFLADDKGGDFSRPQALAEGATSPRLSLSPSGALAVAFEQDGDLFATLGATFFLPPPIRIFETADLERQPEVTVDSFANTFAAFLIQSTLFYASNAGTPQARFDADRTLGEMPLRVSFTDLSQGDVTGWSWEFGDGSGSTDRSPVHIFAETGEYRVQLRVSGPGGESPIAHQKTILVIDPRNEMRLNDVAVFPGQKNVHVPVLVTHDVATQGFTVAAVFDPGVVTVREVVFEDSNLNGIDPELFAVNISDDPVEPFVTAGILFDVADPFDGRVFPPGLNHRIANIILDISTTARIGAPSRIELRNQVGRPPLNNIFTVNGRTLLPALGEGGTVHIRRLNFPPPRFFRRGDSDLNGIVNLTDAITSLNYLFAGGASPGCFDAADVTDDGALDVSDPAFVLNFLFKSGSYPPAPFPDWGLDPSEDDLPECLLK